MTTSHIDEIEMALEAATKGEWSVAAYIAACSPDRMSAILSQSRKAEALEREGAEKDAEIAKLRGMIRDNGTPRFNAVCERSEQAEARVSELERENAEKEEARAEEWRSRRDAEGSRDAARAAANTLIRENAALREALTPFALEAKGWSSAFPDSCIARTSSVNLGDLRRARALLKGDEP